MSRMYFHLIYIKLSCLLIETCRHFLNYDTHSNLISYFIGVMAGVYMRHEKNKKTHISKVGWMGQVRDKIHKVSLLLQITNFSLWILSLATMFAVVYYRQKTRIDSDFVGKTLCYSFTKPIWCFALVWITYACAKGYGGDIKTFCVNFVNKFLCFRSGKLVVVF